MVAVGLVYIIVIIIVVLKLVIFRRGHHGKILVASASISVTLSLGRSKDGSRLSLCAAFFGRYWFSN